MRKAGARVEDAIPGLREHILVKEAATPLTFQRYTLNKNGSYLGFDARFKRLPQRTPIDGLYLARGWTEPHAGVMGVIRVLLNLVAVAQYNQHRATLNGVHSHSTKL